MARAPYPTDLTDAEYRYLEPYLPPPAATGRPRVRPLREILDAIFYVIRSGCSWRRLPPERLGFRGVLPRRWVVERTFSWTGQSRRLSKDYERLCSTSEALIYAAMTRLMVRRLARQ